MDFNKSLFLLGDLGGTHLNFEIYDIKKNKVLFERTYLTKDFNDSNELILRVLNESKLKPSSMILAIAGPVSNPNIVKMTNSKLVFRKNTLSQKTKISEIIFMNDFSALGLSTNILKTKDLICLGNTKKLSSLKSYSQNAGRVVLGAGTGLGVSYLKLNSECFFEPIETELGHNIFVSRTNYDESLSRFLKRKLGKKKIEWEDVLSGKGLEDLCSFLIYTSRNKFKTAEYSAKEILLGVKNNELFYETYNLFLYYYVKFAQEISRLLAPKTIFFAGGLLQHSLSNLDLKYFNSLFNKEFLSKTEIFVIRDYASSLKGLEFYAKSVIMRN